MASVLPPAMQHQFTNGITNFGHYKNPSSSVGGNMEDSAMGIVAPSRMLIIDPQKQRRVSHPDLPVSRHDYAAQTPIDAIHQTMQQQNAMLPQRQICQTSMLTGNRGSVSAAAAPATMMPQQMAFQQVIPQPMPQQIMSQVPPVRMAAPLPYGDDLSSLTHQLQGMELSAPS